ncbi:MAG: hypothetical protein OEZ20_03850 [candidate division WOR-3 bacterium]|nr:hypothetical protein [candidate division WOR-3 bacterium]MDH5683579.1 hypothetical protein [candidate division WOR-3 bacterium]
MNDYEDLARSALQKILDYQMPTGEWGYYSKSLKDRYLRVRREEYARSEFLSRFRKPNGYRTLTAMEVLKSYCGSMFNSRIGKAVTWFKQNLSSGWFIEWDVFGTGPYPDRSNIPQVEKAPDIRHTAQALLALLKFDRNPGPGLLEGLYNILKTQFENGMWPRKPNFNRIEIFRSVCCAGLLFHALDYRQKLSKLGFKEDFFQEVRVALDRTCAWLMDCLKKHNGLWEDEYQTSMVLERLGPRLIADKRYAYGVELVVATLLERMTDKGWTNSAIRNPEVRYSDVSRYETTVRVCASLCTVQNVESLVPDERLQPIRSYLFERFQPDVIDASDYRYFLQIFYPDCEKFRCIQPKDFFDYLDKKQLAQFPEYHSRDSLLRVMSIWVMDCWERLEGLVEGKALGLPNYDRSFLEKKDEMLKILDTMHQISAQPPVEQLQFFLQQYLESGDLESMRKQLEVFRGKYEVPIERKKPLIGEIWKEVAKLIGIVLGNILKEIPKP